MRSAEDGSTDGGPGRGVRGTARQEQVATVLGLPLSSAARTLAKTDFAEVSNGQLDEEDGGIGGVPWLAPRFPVPRSAPPDTPPRYGAEPGRGVLPGPPAHPRTCLPW